jgi:uncharacterized membrane protein
MPINPALLKHADERRQHLENRIADTITRFAGSIRHLAGTQQTERRRFTCLLRSG